MSGLMRSKLFVPATRPEFFDKALAGQADALSFDLEDAVHESRKSEARDALGARLRATADKGGKLFVVRVNAPDTVHFERDLDAVMCAQLDVINLPKVESAADVNDATAVIERVERSRNLTAPIKLLLNIETPRATRLAHEIAGANKRVMGITIGFGDLFEPLGIDRRDQAATHQLQLSGRLAAAEAGVDAYDGAYPNVADRDGFVAEAERSRRLGFAGKSCIHPSQVALANEVFRPSDAEIAHALRVVQAAAEAARSATGAFMVDGHMVDGPFITRAERIVATARRLGLASAGGAATL